MKSILGHRVFVLRRSWAAGERRLVLLTTRWEKWETDGDCDFVRGTVSGFISMTRGDWDRFDSTDIRDARVQSGGPGQRRGREIRPHRAVRHRDVHWEVRPHYRGFLSQGDRGGLVALGAGDPGHRRYRAVRLHAGPLHQKRTRIHTGLQPRQPAELPGHKADEGSDHKGEKVGESPDCWDYSSAGLSGPVCSLRTGLGLVWELCLTGDVVHLQGRHTMPALFWCGRSCPRCTLQPQHLQKVIRVASSLMSTVFHPSAPWRPVCLPVITSYRLLLCLQHSASAVRDAATPCETPGQPGMTRIQGRQLGGSTASTLTLSPGSCRGVAMFLINRLHKLFRKGDTIESVKLSDVWAPLHRWTRYEVTGGASRWLIRGRGVGWGCVAVPSGCPSAQQCASHLVTWHDVGICHSCCRLNG